MYSKGFTPLEMGNLNRVHGNASGRIKFLSLKGLTFLEIVIAFSLLTVALVGFLRVSDVALDATYRANRVIIATNLARGLLAEIMSKNFADPEEPTNDIGPDAGEATRNDYDDVDDWYRAATLWSESPPRTIGDLPMDGTGGTPNYSDFTRTVEVTFCIIDAEKNIVDVSGTAYDTSDYKHVYVTVSGPYLRDIIVDGVKTSD